MLLLKEINEELEYIKEDTNTENPSFYLKGIFLQSEIKNRNGRIYPQAVLEQEVDRYSRDMIAKKRSFGELNHPSGPSINLDKVSHIITELKQDGKNFIGTAKILTTTPNGRIVQSLMQEGCVLGVSSRGLGSLKESRGSKIVEHLHITTAADIVADPSGPDCFPDNIVENVEWFFNESTGDWVAQEKAVQLVEDFKQKNRADREKDFLEFFGNLLKI